MVLNNFVKIYNDNNLYNDNKCIYINILDTLDVNKSKAYPNDYNNNFKQKRYIKYSEASSIDQAILDSNFTINGWMQTFDFDWSINYDTINQYNGNYYFAGFNYKIIDSISLTTINSSNQNKIIGINNIIPRILELDYNDISFIVDVNNDIGILLATLKPNIRDDTNTAQIMDYYDENTVYYSNNLPTPNTLLDNFYLRFDVYARDVTTGYNKLYYIYENIIDFCEQNASIILGRRVFIYNKNGNDITNNLDTEYLYYEDIQQVNNSFSYSYSYNGGGDSYSYFKQTSSDSYNSSVMSPYILYVEIIFKVISEDIVNNIIQQNNNLSQIYNSSNYIEYNTTNNIYNLIIKMAEKDDNILSTINLSKIIQTMCGIYYPVLSGNTISHLVSILEQTDYQSGDPSLDQLLGQYVANLYNNFNDSTVDISIQIWKIKYYLKPIDYLRLSWIDSSSNPEEDDYDTSIIVPLKQINFHNQTINSYIYNNMHGDHGEITTTQGAVQLVLDSIHTTPNNNQIDYCIPWPSYEKVPLTIKSKSNNTIVKFTHNIGYNGFYNEPYTTDNGINMYRLCVYNSYSSGNILDMCTVGDNGFVQTQQSNSKFVTTIQLQENEIVSFYGHFSDLTNEYINNNLNGIYPEMNIEITQGTVDVYGNIMSLLYTNFSNGLSWTYAIDPLYKYTYSLPFDNCFANLFKKTSSSTVLTSAEHIILPATKITNGCYKGMFEGCSSLTKCPEIIEGTELKESCYMQMFKGCTSLTNRPTLPAYILAPYCYANMFEGCTSLTVAPELPATALAPACYSNMFNGCTSLITAGTLPAFQLYADSYYRMFYNCSSLTYIKCLATNIIDEIEPSYDSTTGKYYNAKNGSIYTGNNPTYCTNEWLVGVSNSGTFIKNSMCTDCGFTWPSGSSGIPSGWTQNTTYNPRSEYLTFTALSDNVYFSFVKLSTHVNVTNFSYSIDNGTTWKQLNITNSNNKTDTINKGEKMLFKASASGVSGATTGNLDGADPTIGFGQGGMGYFKSSGKFRVSGNIYSIYNGSNFASTTALPGGSNNRAAFSYLFYNCYRLIDASGLVTPKTIYPYAFRGLFCNCTSLIAGPQILYHTFSGSRCLQYMFANCASLQITPKLIQTAVSYGGIFYGLFLGCTSLTIAYPLTLINTNTGSYQYMFYGCSSLVVAPKFNFTQIGGQCCFYMFAGCTSLTDVDDLVPTTIGDYTYYCMFDGCSSLIVAPRIYATTWGKAACYCMFQNCTSLLVHVQLTSPINPVRSTFYCMYKGCTKLNDPDAVFWDDPSHPYSYEAIDYNFIFTNVSGTADTTPCSACEAMFMNCSSILDASSITITGTNERGCFQMFQNCSTLQWAPTVTINNTTAQSECFAYMFENCVNLNDIDNISLSATTVSNKSYYRMFHNCTVLTTAPELPATTLATNCYSYMFESCTSLATSPIIRATTAVSGCCAYMFRYCSNLRTITCLVTSGISNNNFNYWVQGVATTGTRIFYKAASANWGTRGVHRIPSGWSIQTYTS